MTWRPAIAEFAVAWQLCPDSCAADHRDLKHEALLVVAYLDLDGRVVGDISNLPVASYRRGGHETERRVSVGEQPAVCADPQREPPGVEYKCAHSLGQRLVKSSANEAITTATVAATATRPGYMTAGMIRMSRNAMVTRLRSASCAAKSTLSGSLPGSAFVISNSNCG